MSEYIERYWRDATPQDAIREPPMVARFRNGSGFKWYIDYLTGIRCNHDYPWYSVRLGSHKHCQVYDAPDPGEGYRLIDPDKDKPQIGDEFSFYSGSQLGWLLIVDSVQTNWSQKNFYRRRIEPSKPKYEPFKWEDRDQLRGRWITWKHEDGAIIETLVAHLAKNPSGGLLINSRNSEWFLQNASFLDTGEPIGRRVE